MRLGRLDHDRLRCDARMLADSGADLVRVVPGDNGEIQDHHADAPLADFKDDGLGKKRVHHGLGRAVLASPASRQMRPRRWRDVNHRRSGSQAGWSRAWFFLSTPRASKRTKGSASVSASGA